MHISEDEQLRMKQQVLLESYSRILSDPPQYNKKKLNLMTLTTCRYWKDSNNTRQTLPTNKPDLLELPKEVQIISDLEQTRKPNICRVPHNLPFNWRYKKVFYNLLISSN